jgi:hypothetical protein
MINNIIYNDNKISFRDIKIYTTKYGINLVTNLQKLLLKIGLDTTLIYDIDINDNNLHIILFPFTTNKIPKYYIIYQLEQLNKSNWIDDKYLIDIYYSILTLEYNLWNYDNFDKQLKHKIVYQPIPIYYDFKDNKKYKYDILFYGTLNNKRISILQKLQQKFKIIILDKTFGDEINDYIKKSKIIINLHYYDNGLFQIVRIHELLNYNNIIISEIPDINDKSYLDYKDVVVFIEQIKDDLSNINILEEKIEYNLKNFKKIIEENKNIRIKKIKELMNKSLYYLTRNLIACNIIPYDKFKINIDDNKDNIIYCLTLDEYKYRLDKFKEINKNYLDKIKYYIGVKINPGWIGCGMSYKILINNFKNSNKKYLTICEDDCLLPDNFNEIYDKILNYLDKQNYDMFVGLIADFDYNTIISKIEDVNGIKYIHINNYTSAVFNIYSKNICDKIISWNQYDMDVHNNTMDRYLQIQNLKIITTYPFYFDCINIQSTLWGTTNYDNMIIKSQNLLKLKIDQFLNNK